LLVEVHGSEAGVAEAWAAAEDVLRGGGGEPLVLPGGRDAWSIREHATRSIAALRPDTATVRADLAIPIGALPRLVARCEAVAAERGLAVHLFGHAGIGILHALVLADMAERAAAEAARDVLGEEALTMGPPGARDGLVECLALGADRALHLLDPLLAGSDTLATARALAAVLLREAPDLVLFGRASTDAETGQVGPEVAEMLDLPQ